MRYDDPSLDPLEAALEQSYGLPRGIMALVRRTGEWWDKPSREDNSRTVSPAGARGIYQIMPENWKKLAPSGTDPFDPEEGATVAAKLLQDGLKRYSKQANTSGRDIRMVLAADYNGGPRRTQEYMRTGTSPVKETREYVERISAKLAKTSTPQYNEPTVAEVTPTTVPLFGEDYAVVTPRPLIPEVSQDVADYAMYNSDFDTQLALVDEQMDYDIGRIVDEVMNG